MKKRKRINVIDLFCGCGGLSKGFEDAGYDILIGIDNDNAALKTFELNHNKAIALNTDLSDFSSFGQINKLINKQHVDVIVAGPPCQGFSLSGPRNFDDKRNKLYLAVFDAVKFWNPKAFIIENVPGMATLYKGEIKDEILKRFNSLGYNISAQILCAADYGVPQMRRRLVFMGIRKDIGIPSFPKPILDSSQYITCRQAIGDLPTRNTSLGIDIDVYDKEPLNKYQSKMRGNSKILYNHIATKHKQFVIDTIALVPEGGNYKDLPTGIGESRKFNEAWTRYHGDRPSKTIDTGHRNHFHYCLNRVPTIRENARLQSFADNFVFYGSKTQQNRQVGNAVPPLLGYALGKQLLSLIKSNEND